MREHVTQAAYLAASLLFILGLRSLSSPAKARRGMQQAALGMLLAVIGTLVQQEIVRYEWIAGGMAVGAVIGAAMAIYMPMTAMPQRIAASRNSGSPRQRSVARRLQFTKRCSFASRSGSSSGS